MSRSPSPTRSAQRRAFGLLLRRWRAKRAATQQRLAELAGVSCRHLSFLENGKAAPSRELVQRLAAALQLPLREQNLLLTAAGYAAQYGARALDVPELEPVRRALEFTLRQQEPYPAFVIDGLWDIRMSNAAARRIFGLFGARPGHEAYKNLVRCLFHPQGLRPFVANWNEIAGALIQAIHAEEASALHPRSAGLRRELLAYPDVPEHWHTPDPHAHIPPLTTLQLRQPGLQLAFFSTITTFANPRDVTLQQLRIECMHPADEATAAKASELAAADARARRA